MGYDSYDGTEVAEHSGQEMYGGKGGQHQVVPEDQIAATVAAAAAAAAEIQPSLNRVLSSIDYDLCFKHPLEHTWTLWHWENDRTKAWTDMLSDVTSFNTVEDFFRWGWDAFLWCASVSTFISLQCLLLHQATFGSKGVQRLHGLQGWHTVSFTWWEFLFVIGINHFLQSYVGGRYQ